VPHSTGLEIGIKEENLFCRILTLPLQILPVNDRLSMMKVSNIMQNLCNTKNLTELKLSVYDLNKKNRTFFWPGLIRKYYKH
jgi:hypothetical protein